MFHLGPYHIKSSVVLAPMAGITDQPFRKLCRSMGAGLTTSEMITSDTTLWHSRKSQTRLNHSGEQEPRSIQIAGSDPAMMANAAHENVLRGAQIIDINMGCPAKKVCKKSAGSALLQNESLVQDILTAVRAAVEVPVTLKIRTGWNTDNRNGLTIAKIAEDCGIDALAVHGRTRACRFNGEAEYDTIAAIVDAVKIPVIANGDIDNVQKARYVLEHTNASALMIGRSAQGRPWIFRELNHYLATGCELAPPSPEEIRKTLSSHLNDLHDFYGEHMGVRIARKHVGWYLKTLTHGQQFCKTFNTIGTAQEQRDVIAHYFENLLPQQSPHGEQAA